MKVKKGKGSKSKSGSSKGGHKIKGHDCATAKFDFVVKITSGIPQGESGDILTLITVGDIYLPVPGTEHETKVTSGQGVSTNAGTQGDPQVQSHVTLVTDLGLLSATGVGTVSPNADFAITGGTRAYFGAIGEAFLEDGVVDFMQGEIKYMATLNFCVPK